MGTGPEFFQTPMGRVFFDGTAPRVAKALEEIAKELKRANDLREKTRKESTYKRGDNPEVDSIVDAFWKQFNR